MLKGILLFMFLLGVARASYIQDAQKHMRENVMMVNKDLSNINVLNALEILFIILIAIAY